MPENTASSTSRSMMNGADSGLPEGSAAASLPDPEVLDKAVRRRFTAEYKLRVLRLADHCAPGELGALLRREGLYSSHLTTWRGQRERGELAGLSPTFVAFDDQHTR